MSEQIPNVHDPDIREMVLRDHRPMEMWTMGAELISVHCSVCGKDWPCASVEAARVLDTSAETP